MTQPPPPYPPYGQQPPPYGAPASRSSNRTLWIVLGVVGLVLVLCCGGGIAVLALGLVAADRQLDEERANDTPTEVEIGGGFEHDDFVADEGWRVVGELGDFDIAGLSLTNDAGTTRTADLELTVYRAGTRVATISCLSARLGPEESSIADCTSADAFTRDFDEVRVADSW